MKDSPFDQLCILGPYFQVLHMNLTICVLNLANDVTFNSYVPFVNEPNRRADSL